MSWNPDVYNKFKEERYQPFYDLLSLIKTGPGFKIVDLGCGTGELTKKLSDHFPDSDVWGIDSSAEMLAEAAIFANKNTRFGQTSIEDFIQTPGKYDLVFSNAVLQWMDDHETLMPKIISLVNKGGQLAVQIPSNHHHFTHTILGELAASEPYFGALKGWEKKLSVLGIEEYARIFFDNGSSQITVFEKVYPHVLENADAVYDWVSGTAILRYLERLPENLKEPFTRAYKERIRAACGSRSPVFYPFKRILMHGLF